MNQKSTEDGKGEPLRCGTGYRPEAARRAPALESRRRAGLDAFPAVCVLALMAPSVPGAGGGSRVELKHEYFQDRNRVWNYTPALLLELALTRKWRFGLEQEIDVVSAASRRLGTGGTIPYSDRDLDAVSGASNVEVRHSENPSLTYADKGFTATGSFYLSQESDYISLSPAGSAAWDFNGRNTTLGFSYAVFFDDFRPQGAFAGLGGRKRIHSVGATMAQSLASLTLVAVTGSLIKSWGYLGHPYNPPIDSAGNPFTEAVPGRKQAGALAGQIVQGFRMGERLGSLNLDVRLYRDDWGLMSTTADLKVSRYIAEGLYLRLRGRYYHQTGASFARASYDGSEAYRTADIRSYPFASYLVGAKLSGPFPESWENFALLPDRWDIKYDHTLRDTRGEDAPPPPEGEPRSYRYQFYGADEYYMQGVILAGLVFNL